MKRRRLAAEAVEAVLHVIDEADLALLAVADDVDPRRDLLFDGLDHRSRHPGFVGGALLRRARLEAGQQHLPEVRGARQAADVGREDASRAALHRRAPLSCSARWL